MFNRLKEQLPEWLAGTSVGRRLVEEAEAEELTEHERKRQEAAAALRKAEAFAPTVAGLNLLADLAQLDVDEAYAAYKRAQVAAMKARNEALSASIRLERYTTYWGSILANLPQPAVDRLQVKLEAELAETAAEPDHVDTHTYNGRLIIDRVHWGFTERGARVIALRRMLRDDVPALRRAGLDHAELAQRIEELWDSIPHPRPGRTPAVA